MRQDDHRHFRGVETVYAFTNIVQLMDDFWFDSAPSFRRGLASRRTWWDVPGASHRIRKLGDARARPDRQAHGAAALCPAPQGCERPRARKGAWARLSNVHADVQALTAAGLLDASDGSVRADYDAIETKIAIW